MNENKKREIRASGLILSEDCHKAANDAGWWVDPNTGQDVREWPDYMLAMWIGTKLALVHTEISEALEGLRKDQMDDKLPHRKMFEVELADAAIRIFDLAGGLKLDIAGAIVEKMEYNARRHDHKMEDRQKDGGKKF